ncbi:MAG: recombination mediator RecR [Chloroflexota bacterium]|nr:recombination mediator RecR [Chloroflexota bacterium]MDQ5867529.1 recombination mediator RecR [Chloroflexota bacterium]
MSIQLSVEPVARLIDELNKLPGIGPKSAARLAFYLLKSPKEQTEALAEAITEMKERIVFCSVCFNITEQDPCGICEDNGRDRTKICVVEEPLDVIAIERTNDFKGLYHVLHGALNYMEGVTPQQLKIDELLKRTERKEVEEVILATNATTEGDATAMYINRMLAKQGVRTTRIARGLPMGGDLEYADEVTLSRALEGRREM